MKRLLLLLIFSIYYVSFAVAQTDSLITLAEKSIRNKQDKEGLSYYLQAVRQAEKNKESKKLAYIYNQIANLYEEGKLYEKTLEYLKKSYDINPTPELAYQKANVLTKAGKYQEALLIYNKLLKDLQGTSQADTYKKLSILRKMIIIFQKTSEYESALDFNLQILQIQQELKDEEGVIIATNNVGYTYKYMQKYPQAIKAFEDVLKLETKLGGKYAKNPISRINLGIVYQNVNDYETSLNYLTDANKMIEKEGNKKEMAKMYELLAATYLSKKDFYNARYYNDLALNLAKTIQDRQVLAHVYENSSILYQKEERYDKALDEYKKFLAIRDSLLVEERLNQQEMLQEQIIIEKTEKEMKLRDAENEVREASYKQLQAENERTAKELALRDSEKKLIDERLKRETAEKERSKQELLILQQEAEKQRQERAIVIMRQRELVQEKELEKRSAQEKERLAEIATLEKDKQLQKLALKNSENEKQRQEAEGQKFMYMVYGFGAVAGVIFLFVFIGLLITRRKNAQLAEQKKIIQETNAELVQINEEIATQRDHAESLNKQIAEKNAELVQTNEEIAAQRDHAENLNKLIGEKNEHIMASILYAQRIQQAILVAPEVINQDLPQNFILFEPRDIVSGDFYYFANSNDRIIFAAVDCTGHGVPGALMSMIGHEILEDITIMRRAVSPELVLEELHKGIRKALKQEQTNNRDGMDLAIVSIDKEHRFMEFAGAKNPIIYIQNNEIYHIKGDKMPIGGEQTEATRIFTKHHIPIDAPTVFYMFSDGFQDQFGGKDKKKFTIGRMKEVFLQIHEKDLAVQKEILGKIMQDWIAEGKEYQIDDILVIGAKVS